MASDHQISLDRLLTENIENLPPRAGHSKSSVCVCTSVFNQNIVNIVIQIL